MIAPADIEPIFASQIDWNGIEQMVRLALEAQQKQRQ